MLENDAIIRLVDGLDGSDPGPSRHRIGQVLASLQPDVQRLCRRYVSDHQQAEELAQDALATAFDHIRSFRGEASFRAWVLAIARNHCRNAARKHGETLTADGVLDADADVAPVVSTLQWAEREHLIREAAAAVLSPLEQEVVHLRYVEQLSQDAITELLELDGKSGARAVLQRSRRKLQRAIRAKLVDMGHGSSFVRKPPTE